MSRFKQKTLLVNKTDIKSFMLLMFLKKTSWEYSVSKITDSVALHATVQLKKKAPVLALQLQKQMTGPYGPGQVEEHNKHCEDCRALQSRMMPPFNGDEIKGDPKPGEFLSK